MPSNVLASFG